MDYKKITVYSKPDAEEILIGAFLAEGATGTQVEGGDVPDVSGFDYIDENDFRDAEFSVSAYFPDSVNVSEKMLSLEERIGSIAKTMPEIDFGEIKAFIK